MLPELMMDSPFVLLYLGGIFSFILGTVGILIAKDKQNNPYKYFEQLEKSYYKNKEAHKETHDEIVPLPRELPYTAPAAFHETSAPKTTLASQIQEIRSADSFLPMVLTKTPEEIRALGDALRYAMEQEAEGITVLGAAKVKALPEPATEPIATKQKPTPTPLPTTLLPKAEKTTTVSHSDFMEKLRRGY